MYRFTNSIQDPLICTQMKETKNIVYCSPINSLATAYISSFLLRYHDSFYMTWFETWQSTKQKFISHDTKRGKKDLKKIKWKIKIGLEIVNAKHKQNPTVQSGKKSALNQSIELHETCETTRGIGTLQIKQKKIHQIPLPTWAKKWSINHERRNYSAIFFVDGLLCQNQVP